MPASNPQPHSSFDNEDSQEHSRPHVRSAPGRRGSRWMTAARVGGGAVAIAACVLWASSVWRERPIGPIAPEPERGGTPTDITILPQSVTGARELAPKVDDTAVRTSGSPATLRRSQRPPPAAVPEAPAAVATVDNAMTPVDVPPLVDWAQNFGAPVTASSFLPASPAGADARSTSAATTRAADVEAVLRTVTRYAEALTRMDVSRAAAVWPSIDQRALSDAFRTLEQHLVAFDACAIEMGAADVAVVTCRGSVEYVPKVGSRQPQRTSPQWRFTMNKVGDEWQIDTATALEERSR